MQLINKMISTSSKTEEASKDQHKKKAQFKPRPRKNTSFQKRKNTSFKPKRKKNRFENIFNSTN